MRRIPNAQRRCRASVAAGLAISAALLAGVPAASAAGPPKVPACYSGTGACEGIFLKSSIGAVKETELRGVFTLTSAAPLQSTEPVSCGDAGCLYNHLNWIVSGAQVISGCQVNEATCKVKVGRGGASWTPVLVNQNDYPVNLFLLWAPPKGTHKISGTITTSCRGHCSATRVPISGVAVKVTGTKTVKATTDENGDFEALVPKGSYTVTPTAPGLTFTAPHERVKISGSNATHTDFTGCAAGSLGGSAPTIRAAGSTWSLASGFPCVNFVRLVYSPTTRQLAVTWKTKPLCSAGGGPARVDAKVAAYYIFNKTPVRSPVDVNPASGLITVDINDTSSPPTQVMHVEIAKGGGRATVTVSGASAATHTSAPNHFNGAGGREDCYPKSETLSLKRE